MHRPAIFVVPFCCGMLGTVAVLGLFSQEFCFVGNIALFPFSVIASFVVLIATGLCGGIYRLPLPVPEEPLLRRCVMAFVAPSVLLPILLDYPLYGSAAILAFWLAVVFIPLRKETPPHPQPAQPAE